MALKQVALFDVMRVLRWDIGRALNRPLHPVLWKAIAGWFGGAFLLALLAAGTNWKPSSDIEPLLAASGAALAAAPDLLRTFARRFMHRTGRE
jgi:hypothetical protein